MGVIALLGLGCGLKVGSEDGNESESATDACPLEPSENGWCEPLPTCGRIYVSVHVGEPDCCGIDAAEGCPAFGASFPPETVNDGYSCTFLALRDGTPSLLNTQIYYCDGGWIVDTIVVLGPGEAEVHRSVKKNDGTPMLDSARVQIKPAEYFDACLAPGMPEADPPAAISCARYWFETTGCDDDLCCLQPETAGGEELFCP